MLAARAGEVEALARADVREQLVELVSTRPFASEYGDFVLNVFRSKVDGRHHLAFTMGQLGGAPTLVRVQRENMLGDLFRGSAFGAGTSLAASFEAVAKAGRGVIVHGAHAPPRSPLARKAVHPTGDPDMATKKNPPSRTAGGGANDGGSGRTGEFRGAGPVRTALIRGDRRIAYYAVPMVRASLEKAQTAHQVHSPEIVIEGDEARGIELDLSGFGIRRTLRIDRDGAAHDAALGLAAIARVGRGGGGRRWGSSFVVVRGR